MVKGQLEKVTVTKGFHKYEILGSTKVTDKETCSKLTEKVSAAATRMRSFGDLSACFVPRHGLRISAEDKTIDLVICFECKQIKIYIDAECVWIAKTSRTPEKLMDDVLTAAKVPLAAKAGEEKK